jgi:hypothetical protein
MHLLRECRRLGLVDTADYAREASIASLPRVGAGWRGVVPPAPATRCLAPVRRTYRRASRDPPRCCRGGFPLTPTAPVRITASR